MLRTRLVTLRNTKNIYFANILRLQSSQSNPEHTEKSTPSVDSYKAYTDVKPAPPSKPKLPPRNPLAKEFFLGKVEKDLLAYPEVISREEMAILHSETAKFQSFFDSINETEIDSAKSISKDILDNLKELRLYGINAPDDYSGGRGWQYSQSLIASEAESSVTDVASGLLSHRVVIDTLNEIGTEEQKQLYLPKLANGSLIATEAIFEYNEAEDGFFNTTANHDSVEGVWILNGEKAFVLNGPNAGLFLVIAQTAKLNISNDAGKTTTIFLVDKSTPGVKIGEQHATIGCKGLPSCKVEFNNVKVPESCVVGNANEGSVTAEVVLRSTRLRSSMIALGLSKKILNELTQHSIQNKQCGIALKDLEGIRKHISTLTTSTYAMESMIYLTAGLLDEFDQQDVGMEAAVTKYYTLTRLFENSSKSIDVIGPKSLISGQPTEIAFRNALQLYTQSEPIDSLRMYISLTGLQYAGQNIGETVMKSRNPLFHPGHIFSKFMESSSLENPKSKLRLGEALHPSLEPAAQCIERSVTRLQMAAEILLTKYGQEVVQKHIEIYRLAEIVSHIYAMFASASRASRAYCIGLKLSDYELLLALTICAEGEAKVKTLAYEIFEGPYLNNDHNVNRLTKQVFKSGGYFSEHPLTFNF
ncbi:complex I assembly factor ACAD9, mitochondrial [Episyrphus balteatus]|uniref:complex I assembly factor ACAD9, mitochondrial n=1 Tax=Episyrphus balteatus TaxID=286459 RepID=UPI002486C51D|nr:complex I assembly factor ACAD9, mitochondrial [Episyrphus balteatus]